MSWARQGLWAVLALVAAAGAQPALAAPKHRASMKRVRPRHPTPVVPDSIAPPVRRRPRVYPPSHQVPAAEPTPGGLPGGEGWEEPAADPTAAAAPAEEEATPAAVLDYQGYVRLRGTRAFVDRHALLSGVTAPMSEWQLALEGNLQLRLRALDGHFTLASDLSVLTGTQAPGVALALSELYAQGSFGPVYVLVGRRRVVWGTGLSWNPTDLINPPRDLLEPARTRAGALMLPMVDVALSQLTLSAFLSAPVTYDQFGLPRAVALDTPIAGARLFTNQLGADLSAMYFYDVARRRHSVGAALSSILGDSYEVHAEGIAHLGAPDRPAMQAVDACGPGLGPAPGWGGAAVVGARRDWTDRSLVGVEYLYNSGGFTPDEYRLVRAELPCLRAAAKVAALTDPTRAPPVSSPVVLVRQHYLSLLAQKPHLSEDGWLEHFGLSGGAVVSLSDASTILQGRVDFTAGSFGASLIGAAFLGPGGGEVTLAPTRGVLTLELRYSY